jgi:hypothetical protein
MADDLADAFEAMTAAVLTHGGTRDAVWCAGPRRVVILRAHLPHDPRSEAP